MTLASKVLLASLGALLSLYAERYRQQDALKQFPNDPPDLNLPVEKSYDFIVVGAGDAGCVLARRLADARFSVLLLETGGNTPPILEVLGLADIFRTKPEVAYLYRTTPQKKAGLSTNGVLLTVAGKAMGGGTAINAGAYQRGSPLVYDEWARLTGDSSWRYENMLPYFLLNEKYKGGYPLNGQHSRDGMIPVTRPEYAPGRQLFLQAGQELGFSVGDSNGPQSVGFSQGEQTGENGRRVSTYTAYIQPIEDISEFLTVHRYSTVSQVLFDDHKNAVGVLYKQHGVERVARSLKEVILSAGTYVSPLILINSGIGPIDQLKGVPNVTPIKISPVGKNLMNHVILKAPIMVDDPSFSWTMAGNLSFSDMDQFLEENKGPLASSLVGLGTAFLKSSRTLNQDNQSSDLSWPDIQLSYTYKSLEPSSVSSSVTLVRPLSIGQITLNNSATGFDDDHLPIVDFNYFEDDSDLDVVLEGLVFLDKLTKTRAMQEIGARLVIPKVEQCGQNDTMSRDYLKCYIKYQSGTTHHSSGTCRMGRSDDPRSVVDPQLRVLGVQRLRVCDASILPIIVNANTATPIAAIAEKTAAAIVSDHKGART